MRPQLVWFVISGTVGFLVDACGLYLALAIGLGYFAGRAVSFLCAVWVTWKINRRYTFVSDRSGTAWAEWWRYLAAMLVGGVVNYAAYCTAVLTLRDHTFLPIISVAIGAIAGMSVNFVTAKLWVFKQR
jgi:putative flippase GtrA